MSPNPSNQPYDVFFSHSHADADAVEALATRLEDEASLKVWLDQWVLVPGELWQQKMALGLDQAGSCAVFVGGETPRGWFQQEIQRALNRQVQESTFRVIPVLLPGADPKFVDDFLELRTWVDFREGLDDAEAFHRLVSGVLGRPPGRGPDQPARVRLTPEEKPTPESELPEKVPIERNEKPEPSSETKDESRWKWQYVILPVLITVITGIFGLLPTLLDRETNPTEIPVVIATTEAPTTSPTDTPEPAPSTPTEVSSTEEATPEPTSLQGETPAVTLTPALGLADGCLNADEWTPYKGASLQPGVLGCWDLSRWGINVDRGDIHFARNNTSGQAETRGMFVSIPTDARIDLLVTIDTILTQNDLEPRLLFGLVPESREPDQGYMIRFQRDSEQGNREYIYTQNPGGRRTDLDNLTTFKTDTTYRVTLLIDEKKIEMRVFIDDEEVDVVNLVQLPLEERVLWLGYTLPSGTSLNAVITNLSIQEEG